MNAPAPKVISLSEERRAKREHEHREELRRLGIHTRELVLLQREALIENAEYWHRSYLTLLAQFRREVDRYEERLLWARTDLTIESAERLLERMALEDEIARLRKLIPSDCPF